MGKTVCFTGHRPQSLPFGFDEGHPLCVSLKERLTQKIEQQIQLGADVFYCGMAQGVDILAAEAVLALQKQYPHIRLIAAIPCPDQAARWPRESVLRYARILEKCDRCEMVSDYYFTGCMQKRNRYMVDRADTLLAVYNGDPRGGTANTVQYATKQQKEIIVIEP